MIRISQSSPCCAQCTSCLQAHRRLLWTSKRTLISRRTLSASASRKDEKPNGSSQPSGSTEKGALSRRLAEMTEESLFEGGRSAQKNLQEAGFSDDLKRALEEKIKAASFKSNNAQAFSVLDTPVSFKDRTNSASAGQLTMYQGKRRKRYSRTCHGNTLARDRKRRRYRTSNAR